MEEIKLDVQLRNGKQKIKSKEDIFPAILYGGKMESMPIKVDRRVYAKITRLLKGQNVIFHLNVLEGDKKIKDFSAIIKEEQLDPVSERLLHIDFQRISLTEEIEVKVPITTKGDAVGVKKDGGSLDHALWELDVICLPTNIPAKIEIEVSHLKIGDAIHVKDLILPQGVKTKHNLESIVVSVVPPMKAEVTPAEGTVITEPEVLKEKKPKEVEGEAKSEDKGKPKAEEKSKAEEKAK